MADTGLLGLDTIEAIVSDDNITEKGIFTNDIRDECDRMAQDGSGSF